MVHTIGLVVSYVDYQPVEYGVTKKTLENAGYKIITISDESGKATATDGTTTSVDATLGKIDTQLLDGLFFIGGKGTMVHLDNPTSHELVRKMFEANKPIGGICLASRILAHADVLVGKRATGWDGDNSLGAIFKEHSVNYVKEPCVVDHDIVTAAGPEAALEFAENIITIFETRDRYE